MTVLDQLNFYLWSDRREIMLDEVNEIWIKRLYTEQGLKFECNCRDTIAMCNDADEVRMWFKEIEKKV